jgi:hypothetical protein
MPVLTIIVMLLIPLNLLPLVYCYLQLPCLCQQTAVLAQAVGVDLLKVALADPLSPVHTKNRISTCTV